MANTTTSETNIADPDLRESLRIIRRQRTLHLVGVAVALSAAIATAVAYASLSYSDRDAAAPAQSR